MVDVLTEIVINRPIDEVSNYSISPDNAPQWYDNIKSAVWKTSKPLTVGSQVDFVAHFLGRRLAYTYEVAELVPQELLVMKTAQGPFPMQTTYTWSSIEGSKTKMTLRNKGVPSGFSKLFAPLMAKMMRKANIKDLEKLKSILEAS